MAFLRYSQSMFPIQRPPPSPSRVKRERGGWRADRLIWWRGGKKKETFNKDRQKGYGGERQAKRREMK